MNRREIFRLAHIRVSISMTSKLFNVLISQCIFLRLSGDLSDLHQSQCPRCSILNSLKSLENPLKICIN